MVCFKLTYDARCQVVHSGISAFSPPTGPKNPKILNDQQLAILGDHVRQAVMKFLLLVWRGETDRDAVNIMLDEAALDETIRLKVFRQTDIEAAIEDLLGPAKPIPPLV